MKQRITDLHIFSERHKQVCVVFDQMARDVLASQHSGDPMKGLPGWKTIQTQTTVLK